MKIQNMMLVLIATVLVAGCSTFKPTMPTMPSIFKGKDRESKTAVDGQEEIKYGQPQKMLAVWKDSVRSEIGKPPMRGFGGRIFLYDQSGVPIRAKGELVIYGFDDSVKDRQGSKADQKLVFDNATLQRRYSKSGLGDSYSIWIDWDEVGGPDKSVTLIPFFRTPEGEIVKAGQAIYALHTPSKEDKLHKTKLVSHEDSSDASNSIASQANYLETPGGGSKVRTVGGEEVDSMEQTSGRKSMRTTTISVPSATQKRLRESTNFGIQSKKSSTESAPVTTIERTKVRQYSSRIEAARKKRHEELEKGVVFGVPGQH